MEPGSIAILLHRIEDYRFEEYRNYGSITPNSIDSPELISHKPKLWSRSKGEQPDHKVDALYLHIFPGGHDFMELWTQNTPLTRTGGTLSPPTMEIQGSSLQSRVVYSIWWQLHTATAPVIGMSIAIRLIDLLRPLLFQLLIDRVLPSHQTPYLYLIILLLTVVTVLSSSMIVLTSLTGTQLVNQLTAQIG